MAGRNEFDNETGESHGVLSAESAGYRQHGPGGEFLRLLSCLMTDTVWVAKNAKNHFYKLFNAAAKHPQKIEHRDGRQLVMMSEAAYEELLAGWKMAKAPHSLADRFRETKITQAIARPEKFKHRQPRALEIIGEIEGSYNVQKPRKAPGARDTMRG